MDRSISFSRGKGKYTHTNREIISDNVDRDRIQNNIIIKSQSLSEAYTEIFGKSQTEFNEKQKRKDRKIDDYFCKLFGVSADSKEATVVIKNDNKQQSFYEWVIGVGGAYDTALVDWKNTKGDLIKANPEAAQLAAECLTEYITGNAEADVKSFEERNPNFHICQAIVHMDETTPHMHIDAIPFSDGYKKGMSRQQGIAKALEIMGYGVGDTAIAKWQESERAVFREICERHGFTIRDEQKSRGYTVLTRQYAQYKENELALEQQQELIEEQQELIEEQQQEIDELQAQRSELQGQTLTLSQSVSDLNEQQEQAKEKLLQTLDVEPRPADPKSYGTWEFYDCDLTQGRFESDDKFEKRKHKAYEEYAAPIRQEQADWDSQWGLVEIAQKVLDKRQALERQEKSLTAREIQLADGQQQLAKDKTEFESKVEQAVRVRTAEQDNRIEGLQAQLAEVTAERDELREELYPKADYDYNLGR